MMVPGGYGGQDGGEEKGMLLFKVLKD